jgi:hypothetical protein
MDEFTDKQVEAALRAFTGGMMEDFDKDDAPFLGMRAALAAAEAEAWQPIETAPRDGTVVLIWVISKDGDNVCVPGIWDTQLETLNDSLPPEEYPDPGHWMIPMYGAKNGGWCDDLYREPTHWRPIPSAPKEALDA